MGRPVALLIDDRYVLFPYDLSSKPDCTYVVLGFYHIAHAWGECLQFNLSPVSRSTDYRGSGTPTGGQQHRLCGSLQVRFRVVRQATGTMVDQAGRIRQPRDLQRSRAVSGFLFFTMDMPFSYWSTSPKEDNPIAQYRKCASCHVESPLIYEQGWMCLRPRCPAFWTLLDGRPTPQDLTYSDAFLNATYQCNHEDLEDIAPQPPAAATTNGIVTSRRFTKGWHCKDCGRLSCRRVHLRVYPTRFSCSRCRYKWQHWECQNCGVRGSTSVKTVSRYSLDEELSQSALQVIGKNRVPNEFWSQLNPAFLHHKIADDSGKQLSFAVLAIINVIVTVFQQAYKCLICCSIVWESSLGAITFTYFPRTGRYRAHYLQRVLPSYVHSEGVYT